MELLKEYKYWVAFVIILLAGVFALSEFLSTTPSIRFNEQKFAFEKYTIDVIGFKGSSNRTLIIKRSGKVFRKDLNTTPLQIKGMSKDSIFINYYVFSNKFRDTVKFEKLADCAILVNHYLPISSSFSGEEYSIDSVTNHDGNIFFFTKGVIVDSADQTTLQFNGEAFFKRRFDPSSRSVYFTTFHVADESLLETYRKVL